MPGRIDEGIPFQPLQIAVLTVSDTRTAADDRSGDTLVARIDGAQQAIKDLPLESLYLFPRNDNTGIYLAGTYDPDTGEARSLELKAAP